MDINILKKCPLCGSDHLLVIDKDCNISECQKCCYIFSNPRPSFEDIQVYYSRPLKYNQWIENLDEREDLWVRRLRLMKSRIKQGTLLDVGTGIGQFLDLARRDFTEVNGTEISQSAISIARDRYSLSILQGEIEKIDFKGRKFDNITLFHVLEHVEDPRNVIRICHQLLNNEGKLFIAVPNDILSLKSILKQKFARIGIPLKSGTGRMGLQKLNLDGSIDEIHLSHFTSEVLTDLLKREDFSVEEVSLDPYYASRGIRKLLQGLYYSMNLFIFRVSKKNFYDTIWIVAKKIDA